MGVFTNQTVVEPQDGTEEGNRQAGRCSGTHRDTSSVAGCTLLAAEIAIKLPYLIYQ